MSEMKLGSYKNIGYVKRVKHRCPYLPHFPTYPVRSTHNAFRSTSALMLVNSEA